MSTYAKHGKALAYKIRDRGPNPGCHESCSPAVVTKMVMTTRSRAVLMAILTSSDTGS